MSTKKGARGGRKGQGAVPTVAPRNPTAGQAQPARVCGCQAVGAKFGADEKHNFSKHEPTEASLTSGYTTIKVSASLLSRIQQRELQLTTHKAIFDSAESTKLHQKETVLARQQKEDQVRKKEELKQQRRAERAAKQAREEARQKASGFLSFTYGRSVEDRKAIGTSWVANQLINTKSDSQTAREVQRSTSGPDTLAAATLRQLSNVLSTGQRITRQSLEFKKAALALPDHPSPDQPDLSPLTPDFLHGPAQPLTPADSTTLDSRRESLLHSSHEDFEDMSDKPIYPDSDTAEAIKDVIQNLFALQQHVHQFKPEQQEGVNRQVENVAKSLSTLDEIVTQPSNPLHKLRVAPEIVEYVDDARNPDIFSREFVELVQRGNVVINGKQQAFRGFSQIYAKKLKESFDGLDDEVDLVMGNAGMEEKNGNYVPKVQNGNTP